MKGQRLDQDAAHDREDGRGRTDAKRERESRDEREDGRAPQRTHAVAHVEQRILEERGTELVARVRLGPLQAAELDVRLPARFLWRHAGAQVLVDLPLEVKANFFVETAFERVDSNERSHATPAFSYPAHDGLPLFAFPYVRPFDCRKDNRGSSFRLSTGSRRRTRRRSVSHQQFTVDFTLDGKVNKRPTVGCIHRARSLELVVSSPRPPTNGGKRCHLHGACPQRSFEA